MHDVMGMNEDALNALILELSGKNDSVREIFNHVEDVVASCSENFKCEAGDNFRIKFDELKRNFSIIESNLDGYISDLVRAKESTSVIADDALKRVMQSVDRLNQLSDQQVL